MQEKEPQRIAQIIGKYVGGRVEQVVLNYYKFIDKDKIQFDFIFDNDSVDVPESLIKDLGGRVFYISPYQKVFSYNKDLRKLFKENNYKIVHSHINTLSIFPLFAAFISDVPIRIAHSHSTTNKKEWKKNLLKQILRPTSKIFANNYMACTTHARAFQFGKKQVENGNVHIMNNGICLSDFSFNKQIRDNYRKEFAYGSDDIVIGHVGRFIPQKNHTFIIELFKKLHDINPNYKLALVGKGAKEDEIKELVKNYQLDSCVKFLGQRSDVNNIFQMMDLFLFPSLYEGFGMVCIEAQTSGLACICSKDVPQIAKISDKTSFLDLNDDISIWIEEIKKYSNNYDRTCNLDEISKKGFNIEKEAENLTNYYLNLLEKNV